MGTLRLAANASMGSRCTYTTFGTLPAASASFTLRVISAALRDASSIIAALGLSLGRPPLATVVLPAPVPPIRMYTVGSGVGLVSSRAPPEPGCTCGISSFLTAFEKRACKVGSGPEGAFAASVYCTTVGVYGAYGAAATATTLTGSGTTAGADATAPSDSVNPGQAPFISAAVVITSSAFATTTSSAGGSGVTFAVGGGISTVATTVGLFSATASSFCVASNCAARFALFCCKDATFAFATFCACAMSAFPFSKSAVALSCKPMYGTRASLVCVA